MSKNMFAKQSGGASLKQSGVGGLVASFANGWNAAPVRVEPDLRRAFGGGQGAISDAALSERILDSSAIEAARSRIRANSLNK